MKNFTVEQRTAWEQKRKTPVVNLVFEKVSINKSLGEFHHFKQPVKIEVQAVKLKPGQKFMDCVLQDVTGAEIDFQEVPVPTDIQIGDKATVDGKPCEGSYILGDGSEWQFESGVLKKIIPPSEPTAGSILNKIVNLKKDLVNIKKSFNQ